MKKFQIERLEERIAPARAVVTCAVNDAGEVEHTVTKFDKDGNVRFERTHIMEDEEVCPPGLAGDGGDE